MSKQRVRARYQFVFITILSTLVGYLIFQNAAPFGATIVYNTDLNKDEMKLSPQDRVHTDSSSGQTIYKQADDLIYFTTPMQFHFDYAKVKVIYQNPSPDQEIFLGYHDEEEWHYDSKVIDAPFINNLAWKKVGHDPTLYQKDPQYSSVDEFLKNPPKDKVVGIYQYDSALTEPKADMPDYQPTHTNTVIDTPLRGKHTLYAYLKNEPFKLKIAKQDLNWYKDPDVTTITVYKGDETVYTETIDDDGITDDSKKILPPDEITIQNPGPGLPEPGVYKIVIDAPSDTVITRITTNLHKIVFEGPIFPISNNDVYSKIINKTIPTELFTNALALTAQTYHNDSFQNITVGTQLFPLSELNTERIITPKEEFEEVTLPKSDVVLNGVFGYFAFSKEQFFKPTPYLFLPITSSQDTELADFIVTDYHQLRQEGSWKVAEEMYDISNAYVEDKKLNWLIQAPRLKENNRTIKIKKIEVTLYKKPWF